MRPTLTGARLPPGVPPCHVAAPPSPQPPSREPAWSVDWPGTGRQRSVQPQRVGRDPTSPQTTARGSARTRTTRPDSSSARRVPLPSLAPPNQASADKALVVGRHKTPTAAKQPRRSGRHHRGASQAASLQPARRSRVPIAQTEPIGPGLDSSTLRAGRAQPTNTACSTWTLAAVHVQRVTRACQRATTNRDQHARDEGR
jgi:hypothetical protein